MTDPLSLWWVHSVQIQRLTGGGAVPGGTFASPETVVGFVVNRAKDVISDSGDTITSSTQVALPIGTTRVPPGSRVTLPSVFGGDTRTVIVSSVGDAGGLPLPAHHELALD